MPSRTRPFLVVTIAAALILGAAGAAVATLVGGTGPSAPQTFTTGEPIELVRTYELPRWARAEVALIETDTDYDLSAAVVDLDEDGIPEVLINRGLPLTDVFIPRRPLGVLAWTPEGWRYEVSEAYCREPTFGETRNGMRTLSCGDQLLGWVNGFVAVSPKAVSQSAGLAMQGNPG